MPRRGGVLLVIRVAVLAGAGMLGGTPSGTVLAQQKTLPVFVDGQAQIVREFQDRTQWIQHEQWVETEFDSDGDGKRDRMHVTVTRPRQTETEGLKVPVVYVTSPYFGGTGKGPLWDVKHAVGAVPPPRPSLPPIPFRNENRPPLSDALMNEWVPRGFAVVHSESPGTGLSQGCPTMGGANESLAPKAVIDWLNGRARGFTTVDGTEAVAAPWSTGKVGMVGISFNGTLALAAATTGVKGLAAIIPTAPLTSYYHYYRSNGLVRHPGGWLGEDIDYLYDFVNSGRPERRDYCVATIRKELVARQDRVTGDYSDFWAARDYLTKASKIKAAVLMVHAFDDWNVMPEQSVRIYEALKKLGVPIRAFYYSQGSHGDAAPMAVKNRWFTRYLYGIENGVEKDPRAWIVREGAGSPTPYDDYPNPAAAPVTLHLQPGGRGIGGLDIEHRGGQGKETLVDDVSLRGHVLAQAKQSDHRLLYATPALTQTVHLSGWSTITIRLASSKPAANLSVWLVALSPAGDSIRAAEVITRGWADPQNYKSLTRGEQLVPGQFYTLTFNLQPDDQVISAGKRIGLMIFSSDQDFTLWPPLGTELTVDVDATSLVLPVVGGGAALRRAFGQAP